MSLFRLSVALLGVSAFAATPSYVPSEPPTQLKSLLKDIENRYNGAKTLQVSFTEQYTPAGRPQRMESGTLYLRKPLRMRCEYAFPKGKLCVSDGTFLYVYTPADNRALKMKLKDSLADDMRAPLAFLLGKLHFSKEFRSLQARPEGDDMRITAEPKTDNLPYSSVEFVVTPSSQIREVKVTGFDRSIYDFTFEQEKMDPPLDAKLFQFQTPPGAVLEETAQ